MSAFPNLDDAPTLEALAAQWNIALPADPLASLTAEAVAEAAPDQPASFVMPAASQAYPGVGVYTPTAPPPVATAEGPTPTATPLQQPMVAQPLAQPAYQVPSPQPAPQPAAPPLQAYAQPAQPVPQPQPTPVQPVQPVPPAPAVQPQPQVVTQPQPAPQPQAAPQPQPAPSVVAQPQQAAPSYPSAQAFSVIGSQPPEEDDAEASPLKAVLRLRRRIVSSKEDEAQVSAAPAPQPAQPSPAPQTSTSRYVAHSASQPTPPQPAPQPAAPQPSSQAAPVSLSSKLPVIEPKRRPAPQAPPARGYESRTPKSEDSGLLRLSSRHDRDEEEDEEEYGTPRLITGSPMDRESFEDAIMRRRKERHDKHVRIAVACAILAAIVLVAGVYQFTKNNVDAMASAQADIETYDVIRRDFVKVVEASGALSPVTSTELTAEVDGIIEAVNVTEGATVHAGDVLVTIHNEALSQELQEANDKLAAANDTLLVAQGQLADATSNYESAKAAYEQAYANYRQQVAAAQATGAPITGLTPPTWSEQSYQSMVNAAQSTFDQAAAAQQTAQKNQAEVQARADKRNLVAPVDGTVVGLKAEVGNNVIASATAGQPTVLLTVADLSSFVVKVQVPEADIIKLSPGMVAQVDFPALPDYQAEGTISAIGTTASAGSTEDDNGKKSVKYDVTVLIAYPDWLLRPDMSADIRVTVDTIPEALVIPVTAVGSDSDGDSFVVLVHKDAGGIGVLGTSSASATTEKHTITVDSQDSEYAAVSGHIAEGDTIALDVKSITQQE